MVTDEVPGRIRMLGSLRAAKDCVQCHSVGRGELLGAVSYELAPTKWNRRPEPQGVRPSS